MKKSFIMVLMVIGFILSFSVSTLADDNYSQIGINDTIIENNEAGIMPLRYSLINTIGANLDLENGIAYCLGDVSTQKVVAKIEITVILQKFSGGKWTEWAKWSASGTNISEFSLDRSAPHSSGSYRVYVESTVTAYDGETETQTCISDVKP